MSVYIYRVNGFDHTPFDKTQQDWHTHLFPYKLGQYRKTFLTQPFIIAEINFSRHNCGIYFPTQTKGKF